MEDGAAPDSANLIGKGTLIVFAKPPICKDLPSTFYKPKVELSLPWTGINLIMENLGSFDDGMAAARECNDSPHQQTNTSVQGGSSDSSEGFVLKYNLNQHVGNSQGSESVEQSANSLGRRNLFFENIMPRKRKMLHVCRADRQSCIINSKTKQLGSSFHECFDEDLESITSIQDEFDLVNRESQSLLSQYSTVSQMTADQHTHTDTDQNETENDMHSSTKHFEHQKPSAITELPKALLKRNLKLETFCEMKNEKYDILATVLQVNAERTVKVRTGVNAGKQLQLASVFIADEKCEYIKLTFWNEAIKWTSNIYPSCIVLVTDVVKRQWKGGKSLSTTYSSDIFNFHQPKEPYPPSWHKIITTNVLKSFVNTMRRKFPFLFNDSHRKLLHSLKKVQDIKEFDGISSGTLINVFGRVVSIFVGSDVEKYIYKGDQYPSVLIWIEDESCRQRQMSIWGKQTFRLPLLRKNQGNWLRFTMVAVRSSVTGDGLELHTTSDTVIDISSMKPDSALSSSQMGAQYSKETKNVVGSIKSIQLRRKDGSNFWLSPATFNVASNSSASVTDEIVTANRAQDWKTLSTVLYTACSNCFSEISCGADDGFTSCKRCVSNTWKYDFATIETLRPFNILIDAGASDVSVSVYPSVLNGHKSNEVFANLFQLCSMAKQASWMGLVAKSCISNIFKRKDFMFIVSLGGPGSSDTIDCNETYLLKSLAAL